MRNESPTNETIVATGGVVESKFIIPPAPNAQGQQDNYVAIPRPVGVSLKHSGLIGSGAFKPSRAGARGDELLYFKNAAAGYDKEPARIYIYKGGIWRWVGSAGNAGDDVVFKPGSGVVIRKAAKANSATALWTNPRKYAD